MDYLNSSKGSEGDLQIDAIEGKAKKFFYKHDQSFPAEPRADARHRVLRHRRRAVNPVNMCAPARGRLGRRRLAAMNFKMTDKPFRFNYTFARRRDGVTAVAQGDLDCDAATGTTKKS